MLRHVALSALCLAAGLALGARAQAAEVTITVTDADGKSLPDAVVFVYEAPGKPVAPKEPYLMDQVDKEFVPRVLPIVVGSSVKFPNKDDIHHHIYSFSAPKSFELPLYKGEPANPVVFDKPGVVKLGCNIHDWMSGAILVLPNRYFAVTDKIGRAVLPLPDGSAKVEAAVFHERLKGSVDETKRKVDAGSAVGWQVPLKPEKKKKRKEVDY